MSCQHNLLILFLCCVAALTVSAQTCGEQVLEGTSCSINGETTNNEKAAEIRWAFTSSDGTTAEWKKGSRRKPPAGLTIEEDGSLRLESVRQNNTGTYKYTAFNANGQQIGTETVELKVYAKVNKPNVKIECKPDGTVTLLCDTGNYKDLKISWYEDDKIMQDEKTTHLTLKSTKINENTQYACSVSNPASSEQSDRITVPSKATKSTVRLNSTAKGTVKLICDAGNAKDQTISCYEDHMKDETKTNLTLTSSKVEGKRYSCSEQTSSKLSCSSPNLCLNYYAVLGVLAGGGVLLFLLICVFIWCACQSCRKKNRLL
ncbi:uncharacterized protein si:ch211-132g1.4 isoform X2 [Danio rerio]|uniref:Uncharacterized protein si:ch211-132g1.4 isoform X2 n=2 Tax=Danio rerio TaxID=7955 RepID=A0AC58JG19_DANRE|nr:hemicentin-1-like isoform X2 [Danio rerio]|eukprot:XP_009303771.1 hemicentin-1-like isoform X2 [Danio rerio]